MKRFAALLAAAALLPTAASAQHVPETHRMSIPTAGIPLTDPAAVAALRKRIARAARHVCSDHDRSVHALDASRRCVTVAIEDANRQLDRLVDHSRSVASLARRAR